MNDKKKLIELFVYIAIVVVGLILLMTSGKKEDVENMMMNTGGVMYAAVLDE